MNDFIVYPNEIKPVKLPIAKRSDWREFIQFLIGPRNLPVFWTGSSNRDFNWVFSGAYQKIKNYFEEYHVVGTGKLLRPDCDELFLIGENIDKEHLVSLAEHFPSRINLYINKSSNYRL